MKLIDGPILIVVVIAVAVCAGLILLGIESEKQWQAWVVKHECRIIEKTQGEHHTGVVMIDGKPSVVTTYTPGKTAWLCDDGVTYWR